MLLKLLRFVREDTLPLLQAYRIPKSDLYTYHFEDRSGHFRRLHLRIEPDGQGVLFVDVTDAIHLNQTAALIAMWALEGLPEQKAKKRLKFRFGSDPRVNKDVLQIY